MRVQNRTQHGHEPPPSPRGEAEDATKLFNDSLKASVEERNRLWEKLLDKCEARLMAHARRFCSGVGQGLNPEDLYQDTLAVCAKRQKPLEHRPDVPDPFLAFARGVMWRLGKSTLRKWYYQLSASGDLAFHGRDIDELVVECSEHIGIADLAELRITGAALLARIRQLPARTIQIITLVSDEELSWEERSKLSGLGRTRMNQIYVEATDQLVNELKFTLDDEKLKSLINVVLSYPEVFEEHLV